MSYTLNRTGAQIDAIGTGFSAGNTITSIEPNTNTNLASITVPAGTWILVAQVRFQMPEAGKTMIGSISTTSGSTNTSGGGFGQLESSYSGGYMSMNLVRIWSPAEETAFYLVGYHNCSTNATAQAGQCYIRAIRLR